MANNLTEVIPKILAQGLITLRSACVMPALVNNDYAADAAQKGATVDVPIPSAVTAVPVTPGPTPPATADSIPTSVAIPLDQWQEAPFYLTDKDLKEADSGIIPMQASEAIKALANFVNADIMAKYKGIWGFQGTPGTTPFASTTSDATQTRKVLNNQLAPLSDRRFVIDPDAEANALDLRAFQDFSFSGDINVIREGQINRKLGFNWLMDQQIPTHTAGTVTGAPTVTGVNAIGAKTINLTTGAGEAVDILEGDIVTFAGDSQTYAASADLTIGASATGDLLLHNGLAQATAGTEVVTVKGDHVVNLAFHRDAFAFASRPLEDEANAGLGSIIQAATDPVSGLSLRLEVTREHKRIRWSYDILFGSQLVRGELGVRCAG
jgi:hypothetical protein